MEMSLKSYHLGKNGWISHNFEMETYHRKTRKTEEPKKMETGVTSIILTPPPSGLRPSSFKLHLPRQINTVT